MSEHRKGYLEKMTTQAKTGKAQGQKTACIKTSEREQCTQKTLREQFELKSHKAAGTRSKGLNSLYSFSNMFMIIYSFIEH